MRRWVIATLMLAALVGAGCGSPGGSADENAKEQDEKASSTAEKPDVAAAGDVTLTVWDQEVRGGQAAQIKQLNEQFQQKYPNVTIKRVARSFDDLNKTLKLAVSGPNAPDVVQANQGRPIMGTLVKGGLLEPLDPYAEAFGWEDRWSPLLLDLNKFSSDGDEFGSGNLYGALADGRDRRRLLQQEQGLRAAQDARRVRSVAQGGQGRRRHPDPVRQPRRVARHPRVRDRARAERARRSRCATSCSRARARRSTTPEFQAAATKLQEWVDDGYFTPDFNGTGYDAAWQRFAKGKGRYLIAGTWLTADLAEADGRRRRVHADAGHRRRRATRSRSAARACRGRSRRSPRTRTSRPRTSTSSPTPTRRTCWRRRATSPPCRSTRGRSRKGCRAEVFAEWTRLNEADGIIPYLDYTTPTFFDDISAAIQELMGGKSDPAQFTAGVQEAFAKFADAR